MTRTERKQYTELKTDRQTAAELARVLDKHFGFIETTSPEHKLEQQAFYEGMFYAAELLFSVKKDKQGNHHITPYPTD